jgi:hypothetical protein
MDAPGNVDLLRLHGQHTEADAMRDRLVHRRPHSASRLTTSLSTKYGPAGGLRGDP